MDSETGLVIIATFAAAVAAGVAALYAGWQAAVAHSALEVTRQVHRDQSQPYIFADIRMDEHQPQVVMLLLRNEGPTVAKRICVKFNPPLIAVVVPQNKLVEEWAISALTPGAQLVRALGVGSNFFDSNGRTMCKVTITATGPFGPIEKNEYEIDLSRLAETAAGHRTLHHAAKALEEVAQHTKEIVKKMTPS